MTPLKPKSDNLVTKQDLLDFQENLLRGKVKTEDDPLEQLSKRFEALWELVKDRLELSDEDLEKQLQAMQPSVSEKENPKDKTPEPCPKCGRPLLLRTNHCAFCGADEDTVAKAMKIFSGKTYSSD